MKTIEENTESKTNSDYLILNPTALFSKVERDFNSYNSYERIELFLYNDKSGKETTHKFLSLFSQAKNHSYILFNFGENSIHKIPTYTNEKPTSAFRRKHQKIPTENRS